MSIFSCPIDQLHVCGLLDHNSQDAGFRNGVGDIRYIAAKRLQRCDPSEFSRVSRSFPDQAALVFQIVRGGVVLPSSSARWLPDLQKGLDAAAEYWGLG